MAMESLTVNLIGAARLVRHSGRDYLVAPVTSIVPGVLNGSQGALFYPPHEIRANVSDWDRKPLTVYHPMSPNGRHISAHSKDGRLDPAVWERQGIGHIQNSRYRGKLQHEAWFDIVRTHNADRRFGTDMLPRLRAGKPIELSTGLFTDNEPVQALNGFQPSFNGRPYTHVARNYRPDHLAILPNQVGACSVADGCGVLVNRLNPSQMRVGDRFDRVLVNGRVRYKILSANSENQPRDEYGRWLSEVNEILQHTVGKTHEDFPRDPKQLHEVGALPKQAAVALVTSGRGEKAQQPKVQKWPAGKGVDPKKLARTIEKLRAELHGSTENVNPEGCNQYKSCEVGGLSSQEMKGHPHAGLSKEEAVEQLGSQVHRLGETRLPDSNPRGYDTKNFPKGVNGEKLRADVKEAIRTEPGGFSRPTISKIYDKVKTSHPKLTVAQFQGSLVKMMVDRSVNLHPYTQALSGLSHKDVNMAIPIDREVRHYITANANPKGHNQYTSGGTSKATGAMVGKDLGARLLDKAAIHHVDEENKLIHLQPHGMGNVFHTQTIAGQFEDKHPEWNVIVRDPSASHKADVHNVADDPQCPT